MRIMGLQHEMATPATLATVTEADRQWQSDADDPDISASLCRHRINEQLVAQCEAMMQHAMAAGLPVPPALPGRLDAYLARGGRTGVAALPGASGADVLDGEPEPPASPVQEIGAIYQALAAIVVPSNGRSARPSARSGRYPSSVIF